MTIPPHSRRDTDTPNGVIVTLDEIYRQVQATDDKVDRLANAVGDMVAINRRLDQHHDRLNDHGTRLGTVETAQAIAAAAQRPKVHWSVITGAIVGIVAGVVSLITLLSILGDISDALGGR